MLPNWLKVMSQARRMMNGVIMAVYEGDATTAEWVLGGEWSKVVFGWHEPFSASTIGPHQVLRIKWYQHGL